MISPGVQNPHCTAPASTNACWTSVGAPSGGDALDRDDRLTDRRGRQHQARAHQHAVDQHAARAALALLARALGAEQAEALAQHVEQALAQPRVGHLVVVAVDVQDVVLAVVASCRHLRARSRGGPVGGRARRRRGAGTRRSTGGRDRAARRRHQLGEPLEIGVGATSSVDQSSDAGEMRLGLGAAQDRSARPSRARRATLPLDAVEHDAGAGDGDHHGVAHADLGVALPAVDHRHA